MCIRDRAGPGTLALSADNTIGGNIVVSNGVLVLAGANNANGRLGKASSLTINSGATVSVAQDNALSGTAAANKVPVTINAGGALIGEGNLGGNIWGTLTLKGGTLSNTGGGGNTFGSWLINSNVVVNGGTNVSTLSSTAVCMVQPGGTIFDVANGGTPGGVDLLVTRIFIDALNVTETSLIKNGAGTMKLTGSGTNPHLTPTIINNGRFLVDGSLVSTLSGVASPVTVNAGGTLGGTGIVGVVTFNAGSFAELTLGSPLTLSNSLTVATVGTLPVVKVNLTNNVAPGTYPLATYNATGSSGAFASTPMILTGSLSAGNVGTITTASGAVSLVVAPTGNTTAPGFPANAIQVSGGTVSLTATGALGSTYKLWASTNVALTPITTTWTLLTSGTVTVSPFTITDPGAVTNQQRFYLFSAP